MNVAAIKSNGLPIRRPKKKANQATESKANLVHKVNSGKSKRMILVTLQRRLGESDLNLIGREF